MPLGKSIGVGEGVIALPAEIVGGNREDDLCGLAGSRDRVLEVLPAQVHVGHEAKQPRVLVQGQRRGDRHVVLMRRDEELVVDDAHRVTPARVTGALAKIRPTLDRSVRTRPVGV